MRFAFLAFSTELLATLRRRLSEEAALARRDALTGVLNTRAFLERLEYSVALSRREPRPNTLAYIDLDDFKQVNDSYGHGRGDELLRAVGQTLSESTRATDSVARVGGDEFAILFPDTDSVGPSDVLDKLRGRLEQTLANQGVAVTCSIGAVTFPQPPASVHEAMRVADEMMYAVKRRGKHAVGLGIFDPQSGGVVEAPLPLQKQRNPTSS